MWGGQALGLHGEDAEWWNYRIYVFAFCLIRNADF